MEQNWQRIVMGWLLVFVCGSSCMAADKDEKAQLLLAKSFQQSTPWKGSPVHLTATFSVPVAGKNPATIQYALSWSGPDKWRSEWSGEGYSNVTVVRDGLRYTYGNGSSTPARVLLFEQALGALDGFSPLGPFSPPLGYPQAKSA